MIRRKSVNDVTEAELSVLKALWENGPSTIRELTDRLYPGGDAAHYATVQKLLERLRSKSCVGRRAKGRGHLYAARVERDALIARRLRNTANQLCEGSLTPLLTQLVRGGSLTEDELADLRDLVERAGRDAEGS